MPPSLDFDSLSLAFGSRPDLVADIQKHAAAAAAAESPELVALFNKISSYVIDQAAADEPLQKRRRVVDGGEQGLPSRPNGGAAETTTDSLAAAAAETVLLEIKDLSVAIPQRKKLDLVITQTYLYARAANTTQPLPGLVYAWRDMEHVLYVPVPEKAQVQHNYVLLPRGAALASLAAKGGAPANAVEPLMFTVPATAPKPGSVTGPSAGLAAAVSDSYQALLHWAIEGQLRSVGNRFVGSTGIVAPDARVFHSAARQPFRPQEKAVHVRAFRGSKDGYLFFLPTGILWAFKKPLLFIPLDRVLAVSYTNVLQRTFNIVVEVDVGDGGSEEVEFGMLDQEDYNAIAETYVRRHGLQDRSMAEQRKAKRELAENARDRGGEGVGEGEGEGEGEDVTKEGEGDDGGAPEDDGMTELQRAEKMLQDAEDEEEEDYDPGSDSDSDGSGSSEEEEEGDDDEGEEEEEEEEEGEGDGAMETDK